MPLPDYQYRRTNVLGTGGFGTVYRAVRSDTLPVAVKVIPVETVNANAKLLAREVDIMHQLSLSRHECVMQLSDALLAVPSIHHGATDLKCAFEVHLVMPLYASTLHGYAQSLRHTYNQVAAAGCSHVASSACCSTVASPLLATGAVNHAVPEESRQMLRAVASHAPFLAFRLIAGLQYVHKCGLVHRDLKPANTMVTLDSHDPRRSLAVLGDFGLCSAAAPSDTFYVGTRQYRGPEVITTAASRRNDASMDIWSMGCTLYEIATGCPLFALPSVRDARGAWSSQNASAQLDALMNIWGRPDTATVAKMSAATNVKSYLMKTRDRPCRVPELVQQNFKLLPPGVPGREELVELWVDLIMRCLRWLPEERPTCKDLLQHPLFRRAHCFVVYSEPERAAVLQQHPDALVVLEPQPISYKGGATKETKEGNKEKIQLVVQRVHAAATSNNGAATSASKVPSTTTVNDAETASSDDDHDADFPIPVTPRVRTAFADYASVLTDPHTALARAAAFLREINLSDAERKDLLAIRRFCEIQLTSSGLDEDAPAPSRLEVRGSGEPLDACSNDDVHASVHRTPLRLHGGDGAPIDDCIGAECWVTGDHFVSTGATADQFDLVFDSVTALDQN